MSYLSYVFWIIILLIILVVVIVKKIKLKDLKRNKSFNLKNLPLSKEIPKFITKKVSEVKYSSKIHTINVIFIDEKGNFYLGGGELRNVKNQHVVKFHSDKEYEKQFNPSNKSRVFHNSFGSEEVLIFDSINPSNIRLRPSLDEKNITLMASKQRYDDARLNLEKGIIHSAILGLDSNIIRIIMLFFIAGISFGLVFGWYLTIKFF